MISYYELSSGIRCIIAMLLVITEIGFFKNILSALESKRTGNFLLCMFLFLISYGLQEISILTVELHLYESVGNHPNLLLKSMMDIGIIGILPKKIPTAYVLIMVMILLILAVLMSRLNHVYRKNHLTKNVIKEFSDCMDVGICYYIPGGRVVFQNTEMDDLCNEILGKSLLNGEELFEAVKTGRVVLSDQRVKRFDHRIIQSGKITYHELLAFDITEFSEKSDKLAKENEELERLNEMLREYNQNIDDVIRREETLQAKISIHDEMNRLLLMTVASENQEDPEHHREILKMWKQNMMLYGNGYEKAEKDLKSLYDFSNLLGIDLVLLGDDPSTLSEKIREVFCMATREALSNAAKHAHATELTAGVSIVNHTVRFCFSNNGTIPEMKVTPKGGLLNLSGIVHDLGGKFEITVADHLELLIEFEL